MLPLFPAQTMQETIEVTLASLRAPASVVSTVTGPRLTRFGLRPAPGVRVGSIVRLAPDLALALAAQSVRIAPIPGSSLLGLDLMRLEPSPVLLTDLLATTAFIRSDAHLPLALGVDSVGQPLIADLAALPHLLIAGATGSGKSICLHSLIGSLVARHSPDTLRFVMIDPKMVEFSNYNGRLPHLLRPVVTDMKDTGCVLRWLQQEMSRRYQLMASAGARDRIQYNARVLGQPRAIRLPFVVVVVDEMADLMMGARASTEEAVSRLAALGRATGIHLIVATQRPSVDVLTGTIKANFPARIAFSVRTAIDSRTILAQAGAEKLLGRGDGLWLAPDAPPLRFQGAFASDHDITSCVNQWNHTW